MQSHTPRVFGNHVLSHPPIKNSDISLTQPSHEEVKYNVNATKYCTLSLYEKLRELCNIQNLDLHVLSKWCSLVKLLVAEAN